MEKIIVNDWQLGPNRAVETAVILRHDIHPEGLDVDRLRFVASGSVEPDPQSGHIVSVLAGRGTLVVRPDVCPSPIRLEAGVHVYLPPHAAARLEGTADLELVHVSSPVASQARGEHLLVRDERFLAASAVPSRSLRWILTPQYLSRRIFLYHDRVLCSRLGDPVSWFRTTMFDVAGLPSNQDGEPVFKMSYNCRTEFNVCYDVVGRARVRLAEHPYQETGQRWAPWIPLDGNVTYHLNEIAGGPDEERRVDATSGEVETFRNRHEVSILDGSVTLFCLHDPAAAGMERHRPGEYSDYEPLERVLETPAYAEYLGALADCDEMVGRLSLARAVGELSTFQGTPLWERYLEGLASQMAVEASLVATLEADGFGRDRVLAPWMVRPNIDSDAAGPTLATRSQTA